MFKKVLIGISLIFIVTGCSVNVMEVGNLKESTIKVEKDDAKEIEVELNIGAGKLDLTGGAEHWVEGVIEYNVEKLEPKVSYEQKGDTGKVNIEQSTKGLSDIKIGSLKNAWDLQLSENVPLSLLVSTGASDTTLDLRGLQLVDLEVNAGVGDLTVDLSGDWKESFTTNINMGVGSTNVILPADVGVKITSAKGVGKADFVNLISLGDGVYVNEAYEDAKVIITINTQLGVGESKFTVEK